VYHVAVHLIPQPLARDRVLSEEQSAQPARHVQRHHIRQRPGDAVRARVGLDAQEVLFQPIMGGVKLNAALEIIASAMFGIDVDWAHETFFPERAGGFHRAGQAEDANSGDTHGAGFLTDWNAQNLRLGGLARVRRSRFLEMDGSRYRMRRGYSAHHARNSATTREPRSAREITRETWS
jgi:hypothetical protein